MVGVVPLGARYNAPSRTAIRPYAYVGVGLGWTDLTALDEIDRRFNFLLQASVGVCGAPSRRRRPGPSRRGIRTSRTPGPSCPTSA